MIGDHLLVQRRVGFSDAIGFGVRVPGTRVGKPGNIILVGLKQHLAASRRFGESKHAVGDIFSHEEITDKHDDCHRGLGRLVAVLTEGGLHKVFLKRNGVPLFVEQLAFHFGIAFDRLAHGGLRGFKRAEGAKAFALFIIIMIGFALAFDVGFFKQCPDLHGRSLFSLFSGFRSDFSIAQGVYRFGDTGGIRKGRLCFSKHYEILIIGFLIIIFVKLPKKFIQIFVCIVFPCFFLNIFCKCCKYVTIAFIRFF